MINCQNIIFSEKLSQQRLTQFNAILGNRLLNRIICFALFLLGVDRESISNTLHIPPGTIRSLIRAIRTKGISGIEDRRRKYSSFIPLAEDKPPKAFVIMEDENLVIHLGSYGQILKIPLQNFLQVKTVLLTMLNNNLLSGNEIAKVLNLSTTHILNLSRKLQEEDIFALMDKRQGQRKDYIFTPDVKAEVIQQYILDIITEGTTSGTHVSEHLTQRCQMNLSPRTIRSHIEKLGLSKIKRSLPALLEGVKKTP